ncbi:MAG: hypothetical protein ACFFHD_10600 [Promethearchaeota archaeon]
MLNKEDFYHQNFYHQHIRYSFSWNYRHHRNKTSIINPLLYEFRKLETYFERILNKKYAKHMNSIFNSKIFPRVSSFKISGLKSAFIRSFSKKLVQTSKVKKLDSNSKLPKYAQIVYKNFFEENFNKIPGHDPILKYILINDKDSIAKEVPIWKKMNDIYLTGHIDLIQIENNVVKVIDYKPEGNFLLSLPQVAMYGILIKSILKIKNLRCISFNKNKAWEYDPNILKLDIREYLISHGIKKRPWENFF